MYDELTDLSKETVYFLEKSERNHNNLLFSRVNSMNLKLKRKVK